MDLKYSKKQSCDSRNTKNLIIQGDNRHVLKVLGTSTLGKVKCIYIDPPYNNGENYNHYDDNKKHTVWLNDITETLILLEPFLSNEGSIWISIDDNEMHYLKIAADSVFGRKNFICTIVWQQRTTRENRSIFSKNHEYILVYAKNPSSFKLVRNFLPINDTILKRYKNPDNDIRGLWQSISANVQNGHATNSQYYKLISKTGKIHNPPNGRCWVYNEQKMNEEIRKNNIWFGKDGNSVPRIKKFLKDSNKGLTPDTLWFASEAGTNKMAKKHLIDLFPNEKLFDTPKPEELIQKIFQISTNEGDLILDCYMGSGSTITTAHKMKRTYIGIEKETETIDYVIKRLKKVIKGEEGGISKEINWKGGGNYKFYKLKS